MPKKNNQKWIYLLAFALVFSGIGYLVWSGLSQNSVYFLNVSEALAMGTENLNQARLFGKVSTKEVIREERGLGVTFNLVDKDDQSKSIKVKYLGAVPDTFKPGVEVIVEGKMAPDGQLFLAKTLMTKCPSKYKKKAS
ncbi:cytochrome c maturation protein CcmE [Desulfovulcanus sp.]